MKSRFKKNFEKLVFWKASNDDILEENELDIFFKSLFVNAGSEKEIVLDLIKKNHIKDFLFYTNIRNITNILKHGIKPVAKLDLAPEEEYHVWDYHQKDDSINLDFDISSRAHFWKWATDVEIDPKDFMVIGVDPEKLYRTTKNDWIFDRSLGMINVIESISVEDIRWILIRNEQYYNNIKKTIAELGLKVEVYISHDGMVRIGEKE